MRIDPRDKTTQRIRGTTPDVEHAARKLRRALTLAERVLWEALRGKRLEGLKFRCQHPVGWFVLDFYCPSRKLVVEVDGAVHQDPDQMLHDELRDKQLAAFGYRVLRFTNDDVVYALPDVLERIRQAAREAPPPPSQRRCRLSGAQKADGQCSRHDVDTPPGLGAGGPNPTKARSIP